MLTDWFHLINILVTVAESSAKCLEILKRYLEKSGKSRGILFCL